MRKIIFLLARIAVSLIASISIPGVHGALPQPEPEVLVIHDSLAGRLPSGIITGNTVIDMLGHFGLKGKLIPLEHYKAGDIKRHRFVFILGVDEREPSYPSPLLSDIRTASVPVFWISRNLHQLLAFPEVQQKLGFNLSSRVRLTGFKSVLYKNKSLPKADPTLWGIDILDPSKVQVLATALNVSKQAKPYILRSGSFWYCADSPFSYTDEGDRSLAFYDLLHEFFGMPHEDERKALIRLEDISVDDEIEDLRSIADYLYERHIRFQIALIPIFRDPEDNSEIYLSDRPAFVRTIKYMVSKGGMVVLHGVYHQYRGRSGDDYEFWDEQGQKPIQGDSPQLVDQRIRLGLEECFKNGIYPVTWETPHYGASEQDYATIARYFSSSYEAVLSTNNAESGHYFPFTSVDRFGRFIIPENLGYISKDAPDPDGLVGEADRLLVVRDGIASFFFHPWMDRKYLAKVLDGIESLGYRFVDIGDFECRVQMDEHLVQTFTESVHVTLHNHYLHRFFLKSDGTISGEYYSQKKLNTTIRDPGVVPPDGILVMEGVDQIAGEREASTPGWWQNAWEKVQNLVKGKFREEIASTAGISQPQVALIWDDAAPRAEWNNQQSYFSALSAFSFRVTTIKWRDFSREALDSSTILVVPRWSAGKLNSKQVSGITEWLKQGGRLVIDGPGALSQALGVRTERRTLKVRTVQDKHFNSEANPSQQCIWNPPADVARFVVPRQIAVDAIDEDSEMPVVVLAQYGQGRYLYMGARLDPTSRLGYTRLPYFVHYVRDGFGLRLPLQRPQLELYFDPGNSRTKSIESTVQNWRKLGVRAIFAAAYQFWPTWSYNYQHLIELCHQNGILVYAWFELPHVSPKFWDDHREWRAKSATGVDGGHTDVVWRYHMDLDIPECREAAFDFVTSLVKQYPWDGVNIAEMNFDTKDGPNSPQYYTPMGASTRSAFRALEGFDPIDLFKTDSPYYWKQNSAALKKFEIYRSRRILDWHRTLLDQITPIAQERDMEVIVTMLDSLHTPRTFRDTGVDSNLIVSLMDKYPFTLQVEDPAYFWTESPDRYKRFGETYLKLIRDRKRLMFDINVVNDRDLTHSHAPTALPTGIELAQSLISATWASGRAAIYDASTIAFEDLQTLSRVLAHGARVEPRWNSWVTESSQSLLLNAPGRWENFRVDDRVWPGWGENEVSLPAGKHRITVAEKRSFAFFDTSALDLRLLRFTGDLDSLVPTKRGLQFSYDSHLRALALFNRQPFEVKVDGQPLREQPKVLFGTWSIRLPRGKHTVDILADSTATVILDRTSLYSSGLIVIFGFIACGLMILIYMSILARRAIGRAVRGRVASSKS
jgi:uncharacterized protein YdaL